MDTNVTAFNDVPDRAETPVGLNHVVLNVRNMAESHRFWTEIIGLSRLGK